MSQPNESEKRFSVLRVEPSQSRRVDDQLAVEEPMEIRVVFGPDEKRTGRSLSITMRTPDHDFELAAGFLFTEGIISSPDQILDFEFCGAIAPGRQSENIVRVNLHPDTPVEMQRLQRHFYTTSSCGICGKASIDAIENLQIQPITSSLTISRELIFQLPARMRSHQASFRSTGGIHGAALFDSKGELVVLREDVGRHNAVDKLIGSQFLTDQIPLGNAVLVVSGRASFELMQKAVAAGLPMMVAVGAPSSLAVELADQFGATLIGFAGPERFNIYSHPDRVSLATT